MRIPRPTVSAFYLCWAVSFGSFVWFSRAAALAMDKSGVGDLPKWELLNQRASIALSMCLAIWLAAFVRGLIPRGREQLQFLVACGVTGVLAVVLWALSTWGPNAG